MYPFSYLRASSLEQAIRGLARPNAKVMSGGMSLLPVLKHRLAAPELLIDLAQLDSLKGIEASDGFLRIGAMTRHAEVAASQLVKNTLPALCDLAAGIGDVQVRYRGTAGGSIANADPAADYPCAALALNATICTNQRTIAGDDFFTGIFETALAPDEVITRIDFAVPDSAVYLKFPNLASRYAIVGLFMAKVGKRVRIAVTGASGFVFRHRAAEKALEQRFDIESCESVPAPDVDYTSDAHASSEYRQYLVSVLLTRAVQRLSSQY